MNFIYRSLLLLPLLAAVTAAAPPAHALAPSAYAAESALSSGTWVKISVPADGLYRIGATDLRSWGIDPSRAVVLGYGGHRISHVLSKSNYIDDLPAAPQALTAAGLVFYGQGGPQWVSDNDVERFWLEQNDFSDNGYYFVGERADAEAADMPSADCRNVAAAPSAVYYARLHHERELVATPGEAGPILLGEEMRNTRKRTVSFDISDAVADSKLWFKTSFVSNASSSGLLKFTFNGAEVPQINSDIVDAASTSSYVHGNETETRHYVDLGGDAGGKATIDISFTGGGTVSGAWLNYVSVNYQRHLRLTDSGTLVFHSASPALTLAASNADKLHIWDVTDPTAPENIQFNAGGGAATWQRVTTTTRPSTFAVWSDDATFDSPRYVGKVKNQNLHAHSGYDMVIVSPRTFAEQAQRLADFHSSRIDTMRVAVVDPEEIYNEFSSGTLDVGGIRRYLKMLYDRGDSNGHSLRYVIFFGRTTQDNRLLTVSAPSYPTVPSWMPTGMRASLSDNTGYCTDDVTVMLSDGAGASLGSDKLSVAPGRIPVVSVGEARDAVDKIIQYATASPKSAWRHRFLFLADDQDAGQHLTQTEKTIAQYAKHGGKRMLAKKIYLDSYAFVGTTYPGARQDMFRTLDEGVVWWNFVGHASTTGWTHEHQLQYTDLTNMYLRHWPFIAAYTCNFLRLDANAISGGELLFKERYGGVIGMVSAVRPVYIADNGLLSAAMGRALAQIDKYGTPPGEIVRQAKNDVRNSADTRPTSDENRLRYTFIGDPALPLAMPANNVVLDRIKGQPLDGSTQPTFAALEQVPIRGHIESPDGTPLTGFNGVVNVDIFDAEHTVTTNGRGESGKVLNFEAHGQRIYCGSARVVDGVFELTVAMPSEISQNFRPAAMSMYAYTDSGLHDAIGLNTGFYCYGYDESVEADTTDPVIESMVLNHPDFAEGETVNTSPILFATLRDDVGINVSMAGIGHQLVAILDGTVTFTGLSDYYSPSADGTPSGTLAYPMENLQPGKHTLTLRVWDTSGNVAERTIAFNVAEGLAPQIFQIYTDANPASTVANFYLRHNQPDNMVTVTVTVYNLVGRPVWSGMATGRSDMFVTTPVSWDLTDHGGRRVPRGIYLYRADITADGTNYSTASQRLAVTAR